MIVASVIGLICLDLAKDFSRLTSPAIIHTVCLPAGYPVASMSGKIENGELRRPASED